MMEKLIQLYIYICMLSPTHEYFPLSTTSGMFSNLIHTTRIVSNGFFLLYESEGWRKISFHLAIYSSRGSMNRLDQLK